MGQQHRDVGIACRVPVGKGAEIRVTPGIAVHSEHGRPVEIGERIAQGPAGAAQIALDGIDQFHAPIGRPEWVRTCSPR